MSNPSDCILIDWDASETYTLYPTYPGTTDAQVAEVVAACQQGRSRFGPWSYGARAMDLEAACEVVARHLPRRAAVFGAPFLQGADHPEAAELDYYVGFGSGWGPYLAMRLDHGRLDCIEFEFRCNLWSRAEGLALRQAVLDLNRVCPSWITTPGGEWFPVAEAARFDRMCTDRIPG